MGKAAVLPRLSEVLFFGAAGHDEFSISRVAIEAGLDFEKTNIAAARDKKPKRPGPSNQTRPKATQRKRTLWRETAAPCACIYFFIFFAWF